MKVFQPVPPHEKFTSQDVTVGQLICLVLVLSLFSWHLIQPLIFAEVTNRGLTGSVFSTDFKNEKEEMYWIAYGFFTFLSFCGWAAFFITIYRKYFSKTADS
jgi:hypothetical protein